MTHTQRPPISSARDAGDVGVLQRNIAALRQARRAAEANARLPEHIADAITRFAGSIRFVVLHLLLFGGWIVINTGVVPFIEPFDPFPFVMLAMAASVEAIFLSTFVLISQNRMTAISDRRDELNVQISLLAEHEITRLLQIAESIALQVGAALPDVPDLAELKHDIRPDAVLSEIDHQQAGATQIDSQGSTTAQAGRTMLANRNARP
jgi:uncharacterized membrane protein